jgi:hypothetical protein
MGNPKNGNKRRKRKTRMTEMKSMDEVLWPEPESVSVKVAVGERHMRSTFKMTPMTCECPRAWKRMEKRRERRLAVRALGFRTVIGRPGGSRRPVPVERDGRVPLFEDVVETPRFSKERVRLRDWRLLVGVAVHLEGRLHFVRKESTPLAEGQGA